MVKIECSLYCRMEMSGDRLGDDLHSDPAAGGWCCVSLRF